MKNYLAYLNPRPLKDLSSQLHMLIKERLWLKIFVALFLGVLVGTLLGPDVGLLETETAQTIGNWLSLPGNIFLGLIQMIVVPLVFTSVITGLASSEDMEQLKKIGLRALVFFILTTTLAIVIGISIAGIIKPGSYINQGQFNGQETVSSSVSNSVSEPLETPSVGQLPDLISNILPSNPLGSMVEKEMLQVVIFSVILGMGILTMKPDQSKILLDLLGAIQEVSMTVVKTAMLLAPIAVFGLIANTTMGTGLDTLLGMVVYMATVLGGLALLLIVYVLLTLVFAQKSPGWFLRNIREVQLLAFSTSSSATVMPLSIQTTEDKLEVRPSIAQFLIPLGATINMAGTALYQGVATIFLAQVYSVELSLAALTLIVVTTVGASIGSPATPGVGIVILAMVLNSVGIPTEGVALIIGVDRILDMSRTALNVTGDLAACILLDRWVPTSELLQGSKTISGDED